jgi:hypothetical protein
MHSNRYRPSYSLSFPTRVNEEQGALMHTHPIAALRFACPNNTRSHTV